MQSAGWLNKKYKWIRTVFSNIKVTHKIYKCTKIAITYVVLYKWLDKKYN